MAYVLRKLLFSSKYCRQSARGILASCPHVQNLDFNAFLISIIKGNVIKTFPKAFCSHAGYKKLKMGLRPISKFDEIYLPRMQSLETTCEGKLVHAFLRMIKAYSSIIGKGYFKNDLKKFVESSNYKEFCKLLEIKIPQMSPTSLLILYDFIDFPELKAHKLINKICVMILENINNFEVFDKVILYSKVLKYYSTHEESNNIKKVCETYFDKCFPMEFSYQKFSPKQLQLLDMNIPVALKKVVAEKLMEDVLTKVCNQLQQVSVVEKLTSLRDNIVHRNDQKTLLCKSLGDFNSESLILRMFICYRKLCHEDDFFFCRDIYDLFLSKLGKIHNPSVLIRVVEQLCLIGHLDRNLVKTISDNLLIDNAKHLTKNKILSCQNIFVRSAFQDTQPETAVNSIRNFFNSCEFKQFHCSEFREICELCEGLTYLGCDTRSLCNNIFNHVTENYTAAISERNVLFLHHLAKVCLSSGYEVLSEVTLNKLLEAKFQTDGALPSENLNEYFGSENYVLKNCTTSDRHYLDFVAIFDPDNKPIDLSAYHKKRLISPKKYLNVEEIEKPPGCKMIIFQKFQDPQPIIFLNEPVMSGAAKMYLKIFESVDCSVILLPRKFFMSTQEKKEEFLRSQINDIFENLAVQAENS